MDFEDFRKTVIRELPGYLPADYGDAEIRASDVLKNNGTHMKGISVGKKGEMMTTVYLDEAFRDYEENEYVGCLLMSIANEVCKV